MKCDAQQNADVIEALKAKHPLVPDSISERMQELIGKSFKDHVFTKGEISNIAKELVENMHATPEGDIK